MAREGEKANAMKLRLTRNTLIDTVHFDAGSKIEVDDKLGTALVSMRRAVPLAAPEVSDTGALDTAEAAVLVREGKKGK